MNNLSSHFQEKTYFRRVVKILAAYTDMELCGSVAGSEWDSDIANRIHLTYRTHLEVD